MRISPKFLHVPLLAAKTPSPSSIRLKPQSSTGNYTSPRCFSTEVFRNDPFENELLNQFYVEGIGPPSIKLAVQWLYSVKGAKIDLLEKIMYIHGIWPNVNVLTPAQINCFPGDIHQAIEEYKQYVLKYWPNLKHDPKSLASAHSRILEQWTRHGLSTGITANMYLFYGLALRAAFPDNFGITMDKPMKLKEASEQVNEVMKNLELFGEHIGGDVYAEIQAIIDPTNVGGPRIIKEIRPHFVRVLDQGKAKWRPQDVDIKVRYVGSANHGDNIVILPSVRKF